MTTVLRSFTSLVLVVAGTVALLFSAKCGVDAQLTQNYYAKSCPSAEGIVLAIVNARVSADRTLAASLLRLHFHDCFVVGCEASVLLDSTNGNLAEKDSPPNSNSLRGFDVIDQIKAAIEAKCRAVVSCADIVALAARDAVAFIGGPSWRVPTGRRDGSLSSAAMALAGLPSSSVPFSQLQKTFAAVGLNTNDLVVLSAAHTIGRTHCALISSRLYNFPGTSDGIDPTLNKVYARQLRRSCPPGSANMIPMDPSGGGTSFDTNYYDNLYSNKGLFYSDEALLSNGNARSLVQAEMTSQARFFTDFGLSMEKMGRIGALTNVSPFKGEIRLNCHVVNPAVVQTKTVKRTGKPTKKAAKKTAVTKKKPAVHKKPSRKTVKRTRKHKK